MSRMLCHQCSLRCEVNTADLTEAALLCPSCGSEFIELEEQGPLPQQASHLPLFANLPLGRSRTENHTWSTPQGGSVAVSLTTTIVPLQSDTFQAIQEALGRNRGDSGLNALVLHYNQGDSMLFGNLDGSLGMRSFEELLSQLLEAHQPTFTPTGQRTIAALPRLRVANTCNESAHQGCAACEAGEPCSVCHDEFVGGEEVVELPCNHCFHEGCIVPWLEAHNTCPVCRSELPAEDEEEMRRRRGMEQRRQGFPASAAQPAEGLGLTQLFGNHTGNQTQDVGTGVPPGSSTGGEGLGFIPSELADSLQAMLQRAASEEHSREGAGFADHDRSSSFLQQQEQREQYAASIASAPPVPAPSQPSMGSDAGGAQSLSRADSPQGMQGRLYEPASVDLGCHSDLEGPSSPCDDEHGSNQAMEADTSPRRSSHDVMAASLPSESIASASEVELRAFPLAALSDDVSVTTLTDEEGNEDLSRRRSGRSTRSPLAWALRALGRAPGPNDGQ